MFMEEINGFDGKRPIEHFFFRQILVTSNDWSKVWNVIMYRSIGRKQAFQGRYDRFSDWMEIQFRTDIEERDRGLPVQATIVMVVWTFLPKLSVSNISIVATKRREIER